ncbi:bifunctional glycosyltransferase family 2 protein/CDP-glycerol:glycerophosphate glycerophosphotransferase [Streptacidiphilus sp. P02-A3a]|uniref:bifunctional glycosyltransferase/CDP-glycerol:glycerophosphate glycerophosphotransferase n=1 Tax=Streptacidiphilus sp. P02-A3a TaxID=2704468 RepID=UPI0015F8BB29|nr:bifunctional glycosyltransferase family 2 protein/CDP-glycerol:glycerophosphate glycerophosphotransferase [Streptacidiphilus sp. P02-A3a]QMU72636.1 bifunctional glycosyltransferase family 2 protein/CDP-glycerol:glycerophosphate glycerophosphotransferase [Streptacidiphilus sp. P02-A3a]
MPRISVVVPAYQVQAYLGECLDSVLDQSFRDFELIGVDDRSPDGCGEIFDEYARSDERVRVLHLPENVGLGRARNAGIDVATGDYLVFLDSDDTLTPGSLQAIADRLEQTGDPDVLVYDYARTYWDGRVVRSRDAGLFAPVAADGGARPEVFTVAEREELLGLLMVVWNKAYRRGFVEKTGLRFPAGYYEDTPWTYPSMLAAGSMTVLDKVVVHYRQRRQGGNILATVSRKHFDIFAQYDLVFAFLDGHPELERWRPLLHRRMAEHLRTIGNHPDRVPPADRAEFFTRAAEEERRHRPAGAAAVELAADWKTGAVGRLARTAKRTARQAQPQVKRAVAGSVLGAYQRVQRQLPLDPRLAVFGAYWGRVPSCNPAAIEVALRRLAPEIRSVWVVENKRRAEVPEGLTVVGPGSRGYREAISRASYFVNNVNFPDGAPKRPGTVHLQTHHGTPIKRMGLDLREYPAAAGGLDFAKLLERVDRWDYSLSSNRYSTLIWERVYPSSFRTLEYGYPRNDVFYAATADDVAAARAELGVEPGQTVLLYAPTLRDYRASYRPQLDLERLARRLGPGYVLLNRGHYLYDEDSSFGAGGGGRVLDVSRHPSVERLALAADALVTDYSSLMFDYANLDRPIVVFADDWEVYQQTRGVYLDLFSGRPGQAPGPAVRTEDELAELFRSGEWDGPEAAGLRRAFRERFCAFDDGRAAERVVRTVFLGEREPLPFTPLADRTPAPRPV